MMKLFKRIFIFILLLFSSATCAGGDYASAGAFLNLGVGARALGMGSAFTSVSIGPDATYWNPAGLAFSRRMQFLAMHSNLAFDQNYNFVSAINPWRFIGTFGVSWIGYGMSRIEGRTENTKDPEWIFGDYQNALLISFGRKFVDFLSVGVSLKLLHHSLDAFHGMGWGFDAGFLYTPGDRKLRIGIVFQNVQTELEWGQDHVEIIPLTLRSGISYRPIRNAILSFDISQTQGKFIDPRMGFEYRVMGFVPVRFGMENESFSAGAGLKIYAEKANITFDYGFAREPIAFNDIHRISVQIELNQQIDTSEH